MALCSFYFIQYSIFLKHFFFLVFRNCRLWLAIDPIYLGLDCIFLVRKSIEICTHTQTLTYISIKVHNLNQLINSRNHQFKIHKSITPRRIPITLTALHLTQKWFFFHTLKKLMRKNSIRTFNFPSRNCNFHIFTIGFSVTLLLFDVISLFCYG